MRTAWSTLRTRPLLAFLALIFLAACQGTPSISWQPARTTALPLGRAAVSDTSTWANAYFRGTPNSWGTTPMTYLGSHVWETTQSFSGVSDPRFKIDRDGHWTESYPSSDYRVTDNKTYRISFNESTHAITVAEVISQGSQVILHMKPPPEWGVPYIYAWLGSGTTATKLTGAWPGLPMTGEASGWYGYTLAGQSSVNLIFSNRGASQTPNLSRSSEGWYKDGTWYDSNPDNVVAVPAPPSSLTAAATSTSTISLSWTASSTATSYTVYQALSASGTYSPIASTSVTSHTASSLNPGTTYYFKVSASNASGSSAGSAVASATTSSSPVAGLKVHIKKTASASWSKFNCYFWASNGVPASATWPGQAMAAETGGWYGYTIPGSTSSKLLFNNGTSQTVDLARSYEGWFVPTATSGGKVTGVWYDSNPDVSTDQYPATGPILTWNQHTAPETGVVVNFETLSPYIGTVEYGTTTALGLKATEIASVTSHHIELSNLAPATAYSYRVCWNNSASCTKTFTFRTADVDATDITFVVLGDMQDNGIDRRWGDVASEIKKNHGSIDFLVVAGDMPWDDTFDYWSLFFSKGRDLLASKVIMPVVGNHDVPSSDDTTSFRKYFSLPSTGTDCYHDYRVGNASFIALNSEKSTDFVKTTGPQYLFARDVIDLNRADSDAPLWTFVYFHIPPYNAGSRHSGESTSFRDITALFDGNVDWFFGGHEHLYQRMKPLRYNGVAVSSYGTRSDQGVGYIVVPPAGNYPDNTIVSDTKTRSYIAYPGLGSGSTVPSELGFVKVTLSGRTISLQTFGMGTLSSPSPSRIVDQVSYTK